MPKNAQTTTQLHSSHTASKVMLKILQARLQQYMNHELPDVQVGFRKSRGTRDQNAKIHWIMEKARELQKNICFCFIDYAKAFDCVSQFSCVPLFATPWTATHQASLSITNSQFTQTHIYWVGDAILPSHPLPSPSPPASNLSQHQGLFKWVRCLHQVPKVLEYQLQHQSFQWIPRTDFL